MLPLLLFYFAAVVRGGAIEINVNFAVVKKHNPRVNSSGLLSLPTNAPTDDDAKKRHVVNFYIRAKRCRRRRRREWGRGRIRGPMAKRTIIIRG